MARTDAQKAAMYAAYKILERELKQDGELPPGFYLDVTGQEVTVKFPKGCVVEREEGTNGDGTIYKKATQNLYGYTFFALMIRRLRCFNQWNAIRAIILQVVRDALQGGISARAEIQAEDPELAAEIDQLQQSFPVPARCEDTPRICKATKLPATITVKAK